MDIGFWFPRPYRGARLAEELRKLGHRVTIYHSKPIPGDQGCVCRVPYSWVEGLRVLNRTSHEVYYTCRSFLPVMQLSTNNILKSRPYVYTLNAPIWRYYAERNPRIPMQKLMASVVYPALLSLAMQRACALVGNSLYLSRCIQLRFPGYSSKTFAIHNGIDFDGILKGRSRPELWPTGKTRVLSVVTLNYERKTDGAITLLDAFDLISRSRPETSFFMATKCENPEHLNRLERHCKRLSSSNKIRIEVNRDDVPDLLASADIFLYATPPDSSDSLPRVLLEAQAAGVPTVTTDTLGCPEAVIQDITGWVVPYGAVALAEACLRVLERTDLDELAERSRLAAREKFDWAIMARRYEEVFRKATSRPV